MKEKLKAMLARFVGLFKPTLTQAEQDRLDLLQPSLYYDESRQDLRDEELCCQSLGLPVREIDLGPEVGAGVVQPHDPIVPIHPDCHSLQVMSIEPKAQLLRVVPLRDYGVHAPIYTPFQFADYVFDVIAKDKRFSWEQEQWFGVAFDAVGTILGHYLVSMGDNKSCKAGATEVFRTAIALNALAIIGFHNHPGNDPRPSPQDLSNGTDLKLSGRLLGIQVLDCFVVTKDRDWVSYRFGAKPGGKGDLSAEDKCPMDAIYGRDPGRETMELRNLVNGLYMSGKQSEAAKRLLALNDDDDEAPAWLDESRWADDGGRCCEQKRHYHKPQGKPFTVPWRFVLLALAASILGLAAFLLHVATITVP